MIGVTINSMPLTEALIKLENLISKPAELISRQVAVKMLPIIHDRIHKYGLKADGSNIGTYSSSYLKVREKNKRGGDTKVILSFTGNMENDFTVQPTATGYGLGFSRENNYVKAKANQDGTTPHSVREYKRKDGVTVKSHDSKGRKGYGTIYELTAEERATAIELANKQIHDAI